MRIESLFNGAIVRRAGAALALAAVLTARGQPPRTETTNAG